AVSTACWLFGAGPGLNDDFDTSSVHSPGMTLGVWAAANTEPSATANVEAIRRCFMAMIIVAMRTLSNGNVCEGPADARAAQRVQHRDQIDPFLQDRTGNGREHACGREQHPANTQRYAADSALERNAPKPSADVNQLVDFGQRRVDDDNAGGFGRDVALPAECDADGRRQQRRR